MPKVKLLDAPEVVDLVSKRVLQAETKLHKDYARKHRLMVRCVRDAIQLSELDRKVKKTLSDSVLSAINNDPESIAAE